MKKKLLSVALSFVMVASMLVGCGSSTEVAETETAEATTLTIPVSSTVTTLNRLFEGMAEGWLQLAGYVDELYFVDLDETRYYLAESCEVSEDGLTYTVTLRDNLKWHDGEAITADDIVFTIACIQNTDNGTEGTSIAFVNDEAVVVEKVDELTATFTLQEPSASYFEILGQLFLIPEHAFDGNTDIAGSEVNLTDIGSGPYKLVEFNDGENLVLERFEDYYGDEPQIDQIVFTVISDSSAQEVAFENGEINFMQISSDSAAEKYTDAEGVSLYKFAEGRVNYMAWNKYCDTWSDLDAVKAVFLALDQEEIIAGAYGTSMGTAANTIFSNATLFHDDSIEGYSQDLETAKELAESSGLAGKTIKLYYNADRVYMEDTALIIQQQLKEIDVNVEVEGVDSSVCFESAFSDQDDYELYLNGYGCLGDPDTVISGMFNGTWGINVDASDEILDLFIEAAATVDTDARQELYSELQQMAVDQYLVYPIAYPNYTFVTTSNLQGADYYTTTPIFEDYTKLSFE